MKWNEMNRKVKGKGTLVRARRYKARRLCWETEEKGKGSEIWAGGAYTCKSTHTDTLCGVIVNELACFNVPAISLLSLSQSEISCDFKN